MILGCHNNFRTYSWFSLSQFLSFSVISLIMTLCHFLSFLTIKSPFDFFQVLSSMFQSSVLFTIIYCVIFWHFLAFFGIFWHFSYDNTIYIFLRISSVRVLKCEGTQVWENSNVKELKCESTQVREYSSMRVLNRKSPKVRELKCENTQVWEYSIMRVLLIFFFCRCLQ